MILEELRKKALYQNSIEIWIGISEEKKIDWVNTDNYQKFIAFLLKNELSLKQMTICFDESDNARYGGHSKKVFANNLAAINDVNSHCYSIKLKDSAIELIRKFDSRFYYRFNFGLTVASNIFLKLCHCKSLFSPVDRVIV